MLSTPQNLLAALPRKVLRNVFPLSYLAPSALRNVMQPTSSSHAKPCGDEQVLAGAACASSTIVCIESESFDLLHIWLLVFLFLQSNVPACNFNVQHEPLPGPVYPKAEIIAHCQSILLPF